jgi:hypothetical protein
LADCEPATAPTANVAVPWATAFATAAVTVHGGGAGSVIVSVPVHRTCVIGSFNLRSNRIALYLEATTLRSRHGTTTPALWAEEPAAVDLHAPAWQLLLSGGFGLYSQSASQASQGGRRRAGRTAFDWPELAQHGARLDRTNDYAAPTAAEQAWPQRALQTQESLRRVEASGLIWCQNEDRGRISWLDSSVDRAGASARA